MNLLFVPKPIFEKNRDVAGYYISFQQGNALIEEGRASTFEVSLESPFLNLLNEVGLEVVTFNKPVFVPVTNVLLATDLARSCRVDPKSVVWMLNSSIELSPQTLERMTGLRQSGFRFAFFDFRDFSVMDDFFPHVDYVLERDLDMLPKLIRNTMNRHRNIRYVARKIDTLEAYQKAAFFGVELFEGRYYQTLPPNARPNVSPLQVNYLQILNQVSQDDFDFDQFAKIVSRDTALAIQFLRMVNSSHVRENKINSLKHAAAMLGQKEVRRWVTTAVASSLSQEKPGEIARISLLRARFCENLAGYFGMAAHTDNLFLMGLFSVLDAILEMPIEKALSFVHLPDSVREALIAERGEYGPIYSFAKLYEQGDWLEVSRLALVNNMQVEDISGAYMDTLIWYRRLLNMTVDEPVLD